MLTVQIPSYNYFITPLLIILQYKIFCYNKIFYSFHYQWTEEIDDTGMLNMGCDCLCHWLMKLKGLKCVDYHTHTLQVQSFWHCALTEVFSCNLYTYNMLIFAIIALIRQLLHTRARAHTHTHKHTHKSSTYYELFERLSLQTSARIHIVTTEAFHASSQSL